MHAAWANWLFPPHHEVIEGIELVQAKRLESSAQLHVLAAGRRVCHPFRGVQERQLFTGGRPRSCKRTSRRDTGAPKGAECLPDRLRELGKVIGLDPQDVCLGRDDDCCSVLSTSLQASLSKPTVERHSIAHRALQERPQPYPNRYDPELIAPDCTCAAVVSLLLPPLPTPLIPPSSFLLIVPLRYVF